MCRLLEEHVHICVFPHQSLSLVEHQSACRSEFRLETHIKWLKRYSYELVDLRRMRDEASGSATHLSILKGFLKSRKQTFSISVSRLSTSSRSDFTSASAFVRS